jgi:hypothetical protein
MRMRHSSRYLITPCTFSVVLLIFFTSHRVYSQRQALVPRGDSVVYCSRSLDITGSFSYQLPPGGISQRGVEHVSLLGVRRNIPLAPHQPGGSENWTIHPAIGLGLVGFTENRQSMALLLESLVGYRLLSHVRTLGGITFLYKADPYLRSAGELSNMLFITGVIEFHLHPAALQFRIAPTIDRLFGGKGFLLIGSGLALSI